MVEGLAFNLACQAADLSKNGIGKVGIAALCQVGGEHLVVMRVCLVLCQVGGRHACAGGQVYVTCCAVPGEGAERVLFSATRVRMCQRWPKMACMSSGLAAQPV